MPEPISGEIRVKIIEETGPSAAIARGGGVIETRQQKEQTRSLGQLNVSSRGILRTLGMAGGIGALIKFSKVTSTVLQSFFELVGAFVDVLLMPLMPIFAAILKGITPLLPKIAELADKIIGPLIDSLIPLLTSVLEAIVKIVDWLMQFKLFGGAKGITKAERSAEEIKTISELEKSGKIFSDLAKVQQELINKWAAIGVPEALKILSTVPVPPLGKAEIKAVPTSELEGKGFWSPLLDVFSDIGRWMKGEKQFAGFVSETGMYKLHRGETVEREEPFFKVPKEERIEREPLFFKVPKEERIEREPLFFRTPKIIDNRVSLIRTPINVTNSFDINVAGATDVDSLVRKIGDSVTFGLESALRRSR